MHPKEPCMHSKELYMQPKVYMKMFNYTGPSCGQAVRSIDLRKRALSTLKRAQCTTLKRATFTLKKALYTLKRTINILKRAIHTLKRSIHILFLTICELCVQSMSEKEPYVL